MLSQNDVGRVPSRTAIEVDFDVFLEFYALISFPGTCSQGSYATERFDGISSCLAPYTGALSPLTEELFVPINRSR